MIDPGLIRAIIGMEPESGRHRIAQEALAVLTGMELPAERVVPLVKRPIRNTRRVYRLADRVSKLWPSLPKA